MTSALGIKVTPSLLERWRESFAPQVQPFRTGRLDSDAAQIGRRLEPTLDLRDTFHLYDDTDNWTWLDESEFGALSTKVKRALLRGRAATGRLDQIPHHLRDHVEAQRTDSRIVWWPSLLRLVGDQPLVSYVENGLPPSRHREIASETWAGAEALLPRAFDLAGRFPDASGPNCFGNVLAGAGVDGGEFGVGREPFEEWLGERAKPMRGTKRDNRPGVVLVWRNSEGLAEHAAVTIGDGYVFNKGSQGWFSPRVVWTVQETIAASRFRGATLSRYSMIVS